MTIPRVEQLILTDVSFYDMAEYFHAREHFAFLDSRMAGNNLGKFSFIAFDPFLIFKSKGHKIFLSHKDGRTSNLTGDPFDVLNNIMLQYRFDSTISNAMPPFIGGGIGYFAYEMGRLIEFLPVTTRNDLNIPECYICFYNIVLCFDHEKQRGCIVYFTPKGEQDYLSIDAVMREIKSVDSGLYNKRRIPVYAGYAQECSKNIESNFTKEQYMETISHIKEYILAGDVYQVNLSQRFQVNLGGRNTWNIYKRLMELNPAPFASYLNFDDVCVASSSPERFLRVVDGFVETRPIKGTIKRGANVVEDMAMKRHLKNSVKDRAELAMIVDLLRNDLGRVCQPGTVKVERFPELETYPSIHHLSSTITGHLLDDKNVFDLLKASFPGGSITGAPKIRAMEIIDELEPVERGIYTGSIGYIGFDGRTDLNIVIRTIIEKDNIAYAQFGGGVVADSQSDAEYDETLVKGEKIFRTLFQ